MAVTQWLYDRQDNYDNWRQRIYEIRGRFLCKKKFVAKMLQEVFQSRDQTLYF